MPTRRAHVSPRNGPTGKAAFVEREAGKTSIVISAITAIGKGYDAYVAVDASGTFSETRR